MRPIVVVNLLATIAVRADTNLDYTCNALHVTNSGSLSAICDPSAADTPGADGVATFLDLNSALANANGAFVWRIGYGHGSAHRQQPLSKANV